MPGVGRVLLMPQDRLLNPFVPLSITQIPEPCGQVENLSYVDPRGSATGSYAFPADRAVSSRFTPLNRAWIATTVA